MQKIYSITKKTGHLNNPSMFDVCSDNEAKYYKCLCDKYSDIKNENIEYINLPDCTKMPLYINLPNDNIKFFPQFVKLWNLLSNVNLPTNLIPSPQLDDQIVDNFNLPDMSVSNLTGTPNLTDPNSVVIVYSFDNDNINGPIRNLVILL